MMNKIEMMKAMKARHMKTNKVEPIILFHNGDQFEAYGEDAEIVAKTLGLKAEMIDSTLTVRIAESCQEAASNKLLDVGHAVCVSEMRDSSGSFISNISQDEGTE